MEQYKLGKWDLSEITKDPKSPEFKKKINEIQLLSQKFEKIKTELNPKISSKNFKKILQNLVATAQSSIYDRKGFRETYF